MPTRMIQGNFAGAGAEADITGATYTIPANGHVEILQMTFGCVAATWVYLTDLLNVHLAEYYLPAGGHLPVTFEKPWRFQGNAAGTLGIKLRKGAGANQTAGTLLVDEPGNGL